MSTELQFEQNILAAKEDQITVFADNIFRQANLERISFNHHSKSSINVSPC